MSSPTWDFIPNAIEMARIGKQAADYMRGTATQMGGNNGARRTTDSRLENVALGAFMTSVIANAFRMDYDPTTVATVRFKVPINMWQTFETRVAESFKTSLLALGYKAQIARVPYKGKQQRSTVEYEITWAIT